MCKVKKERTWRKMEIKRREKRKEEKEESKKKKGDRRSGPDPITL